MRQALISSAELNQPLWVTHVEKKDSVERILDLLQLQDVADSMIGAGCGLNLKGDTRMRFRMGLEMVGSPEMIPSQLELDMKEPLTVSSLSASPSKPMMMRTSSEFMVPSSFTSVMLMPELSQVKKFTLASPTPISGSRFLSVPSLHRNIWSRPSAPRSDTNTSFPPLRLPSLRPRPRGHSRSIERLFPFEYPYDLANIYPAVYPHNLDNIYPPTDLIDQLTVHPPNLKSQWQEFLDAMNKAICMVILGLAIVLALSLVLGRFAWRKVSNHVRGWRSESNIRIMKNGDRIGDREDKNGMKTTKRSIKDQEFYDTTSKWMFGGGAVGCVAATVYLAGAI